MKKKFLLFICFMFLVGCSNQMDEKTNDLQIVSSDIQSMEQLSTIPTPTPIPTIDPFIKIQDGDFVIYFDGTNNYMDDMVGYERVFTIPEPYNNYETLLNHTDEYTNENVEDFSTSLISYNVISTLENANEVRYEIYDYKVSTIIPIEINNENNIYENEIIDDENNSYKMYSISQDNNAVYYNSVIKLGNDVDVSLFLNTFQQQVYLDWQYFLSDIFVPIKDESDNINATFINDENFITMCLDAYMDITFFDQPYKGMLIISIDKYDGTIIYTFVGYLEDVLLNDTIEDNFSKLNLLNSIKNMYHIDYIGIERKGCT